MLEGAAGTGLSRIALLPPTPHRRAPPCPLPLTPPHSPTPPPPPPLPPSAPLLLRHPPPRICARSVDPESGLPIYSIDALRIGKGAGSTKDCPIDCNCCF